MANSQHKVIKASFTEQQITRGRRYGIVVAKFNSIVTERLVTGALESLERYGVDLASQVVVMEVPGSFEIPLAVKKLIDSENPDAVIALGAVLRGATSHFEHVVSGASNGIAALSLEYGIPVTSGIIAADNLEQALDRAGGKIGNYGSSAALAAMEMISVLSQVSTERKDSR